MLAEQLSDIAIVRELKKDSSNIVDVVLRAYDTMRSQVSISVGDLPEGIILKGLKSWCGGGDVPVEGVLKCEDVQIKARGLLNLKVVKSKNLLIHHMSVHIRFLVKHWHKIIMTVFKKQNRTNDHQTKN